MAQPTYKNFIGTKAIRVPKEIAEDVLSLCKLLDDYKGKNISETPSEIMTKILNQVQIR